MIRPEQIPDEAIKAAKTAYMSGDAHLTTNITAAIAAALNAWEGAHVFVEHQYGVPYDDAIILPLPKEPRT